MKRKALALPVLLLAGQLLGGCDAQAGEDYRGKPLLSMNGSVLIQNQNPPSNLVPALAFLSGKYGTLDFVEAEVVGSFPASFALDVFEPPPDTVIYHWEDPGDENEAPWAMGYITAVSADHPARILGDEDRGGYSGCDANGCTTIEETCSPDGNSCYRRVTQCDAHGANCAVVEETGDPSLLRGWLRYLAGLSENYIVFYFPDGVKANTQFAYILNHEQALAPGYYLAELVKFSDAEKAEQQACYEAATQDALDRFNAEHGTAYEDWWDIPGEIRPREGQAIRGAARERGCVFGPARVKLVDPSQPITVTISPDVEPIPFY